MSRSRDLLQMAVLKTNRVFPFSQLNKAPYVLAVNCFERVCRNFEEIRGVYLRHGLTQRGWVPGISDIDLTVTYARDLSRQDVFRFLTEFSVKLASLRSLFPMLVDVEILDEDHLPALTLFGIRGLETERWKTLLGSSPAFASGRSPDFSKDKLDDAVCRFFEYLLRWYSEPASYLNRQRMQRVASRILRYAPQPIAARATDDPALLVTRVLLALDAWISVEEAGADDASDGEEESILTREDICLLVLGPRRDEGSVRQALLQHRTGDRRLRVVTPRILRYWMQVWQPRQYYDWSDHAELVSGPDVLSQMAQPGDDAYIRGLLNMTSLVLGFPQLEVVVRQERPEWFSGEAFRWMVIRGWYLRLFLETGIYFPSHHETMLNVKRVYAEAYRELAEIEAASKAGNSPMGLLRSRGFCLLKESADAINRLLSATQTGGQSRTAYAVHG